MHDHNNDYPIIWIVKDYNGNVLGQTVQKTAQAAAADAKNRFGRFFGSVEDSGKRKPPNACCNKCGTKPCS